MPGTAPRIRRSTGKPKAVGSLSQQALPFAPAASSAHLWLTLAAPGVSRRSVQASACLLRCGDEQIDLQNGKLHKGSSVLLAPF